jgi:DNA-binding NtrC family response regulator
MSSGWCHRAVTRDVFFTGGTVMEIVILDDVKSRRVAIAESLENNRYKVVQCATSNEFMNALNTMAPGHFLVDVDTWHRGRSMYAYFQIGRKMERFPVLFYNAPQNFTAVTDRVRHEKDFVLQKPSEVDSIVDAVANTF